MKLMLKGWATVAALLAGGLVATNTANAADLPGRMHIVDDAALFSSDAKTQAAKKMSAAKFDRGLHFSVDTHSAIPAEWKSKYDAAKDKVSVIKDWAKSVAKGDKENGPYIFITLKPKGYTVVLIDTQSVNRGFGKSEEDELQHIFDTALRAAAEEGKTADEQRSLRDGALLKATDYVINDMKGSKVVHTDGTPLKDDAKAAAKKQSSAGMSIAGWVCIGLVVLLAIWLVIGVIRALTGSSGGGGGNGGGGGGYGGGGGGGGGFGMGLMGGLFGAMAGMYLYNSMMGTHHSPEAFGGEASAAGDTGADTGDTGAGDYDGGSSSASSGGDYGGGGDTGGGGGDYGGGGGDYGGGGDTGGGGDFGGGGGDYGGGGDF